MQNKLRHFIHGKFFHDFIVSVIIINAIIVGLDTSKTISAQFGDWISLINNACLFIFTIEILLRIVVEKLTFFKRGWNVFDFFIIATSLITEIGVFSVFRIFRIIRILRLVSLIPKMRIVSQALFKTMSSMLGVAVLLVILFYIYAVVATHLYGEQFPQWFGTLGESFYTLFQIMTFESWSMGIVRSVMAVYPNAWIIFISFLLITSYIILNIAIGIVVDCIGEIKNADCQCSEQENNQTELLTKISDLEKEILELKMLLKQHLK
ncbi:hypothetical protein B0187_03980 [Haemophilus paracuniculus]|uniref:Ion transport domain-containing protein n=1 Tax=Haemophilus paracuniculus TaxID=734 RepID=A0A1T0AUE8_9PAST|nr:ion transporter [Haemophilus paracuniculus]OOR99975.1 hypothetical protein B0187_03980 [Haemophilus paracuniculus]